MISTCSAEQWATSLPSCAVVEDVVAEAGHHLAEVQDFLGIGAGLVRVTGLRVRSRHYMEAESSHGIWSSSSFAHLSGSPSLLFFAQLAVGRSHCCCNTPHCRSHGFMTLQPAGSWSVHSSQARQMVFRRWASAASRLCGADSTSPSQGGRCTAVSSMVATESIRRWVRHFVQRYSRGPVRLPLVPCYGQFHLLSITLS